MEQNVVLEMRDISKNFTGVRALSHVDFTLRKGEIHALMGENGAGKSTLIKVLYMNLKVEQFIWLETVMPLLTTRLRKRRQMVSVQYIRR